MAVAWTDYDSFDWSNSKQRPMDDRQKLDLAEWAADLLELPTTDRQRIWGQASPPGRFAATVLRIAPDASHRFRTASARVRIAEVGIKLFKTSPDAQKEARRAVEFHARQLAHLPGLPNPHVQRSVTAGIGRDGQGGKRGYVVQEWVRGFTLEYCVRTLWSATPAEGASIRTIIDQLFAGIIIALWQAGTVWWDIRDANFCYCSERKLLRMIDVDSLSAYSQEILGSAVHWHAREKGRATALPRLRQLCIRLLRSQRGHPKSKVESVWRELWSSIFEPELRLLGLRPGQDQAARAALDRVIAELEDAERRH
jgi:hypothetical protein